MKLGTKTILFGAHCFFLHPFFLAYAWTKLYGFPWDPRLWVAFFVHDIGYWGKEKLDDPLGETHPEVGASIMHRLFDRKDVHFVPQGEEGTLIPEEAEKWWFTRHGAMAVVRDRKWYNFCKYHSRFMAKADDKPFSRLCVADKYAMIVTPAWIYLPMVTLTGEIKEYRDPLTRKKYSETIGNRGSDREWFEEVKVVMRKWVAENKDKAFIY